MPSEARPMVLRSINLPPELDEQLRAVAFVLRRPKSDLIRIFLADRLSWLMKELRTASDEERREILENLSTRITEIGGSSSVEERKRFQEDFARIQRFIDRQQDGTRSSVEPEEDEDDDEATASFEPLQLPDGSPDDDPPELPEGVSDVEVYEPRFPEARKKEPSLPRRRTRSRSAQKT